MWRNNRNIGFDDRLLMLIMIPVTSFIIPFVFFGLRFQKPPYFTGTIFLTTFIMTTAIWIGNRYIMIWARRRYPQFAQVRRRIIIQSLVMLMYTILATNFLGYLLHDYCNLVYNGYPGHSAQDIIINSNNAAIFSSLTLVAIYESIYFMNELRESIEEKELLKRESLQAQLNALKTQVNPHFLFNNLNTLTAVIPDNPKQAIDFVQQLSKVYRHILEVKDEKIIPLQDELDVLKAYAFLLKTRFGNNLDIHIDVAHEKLQKKIVPLSLQLLMENAIKHNIVSSDKPLTIDVYAVNGTLVVSNNLQKKNQVFESTGIGLDNIRNRYKLLSDKIVEVTESNTNFTVSIPLIEN
jgi:two-component system, LytTR family, sensor kinase